MKRKDYERPTMRVVEIQQQGLLMQSGGAKLGGYRYSNDDAWDGNSSSVGGTIGNSWTDSGGDAWE